MERGHIFRGKNVLITGGTGSFGRAFAYRLLTEYEPSRVVIFSRDEWKQWELRESHKIFKSDPRVRFFIGDVRDKSRLKRAFSHVDIVVHAAALKQVPVAEYNPTEFIKTNILGAMNIMDAALDSNVEKVIALSTDKAVNPVNLYGATKLCSDKLFVSGNAYAGSTQGTMFSVVRYGNVLGSRGSIIPFWKELVRKGSSFLPLTDPRMTRFWITLDQAVDFVADCAGVMRGGEIFVPKIPSMKIQDLARAIAPDLEQRVTGIREGEKLHELMTSYEDSRHTYEYDNFYVIASHADAKRFYQERIKANPENLDFKLVREGFIYASHTNTAWLTVDELKQAVERTEAQENFSELKSDLISSDTES